MLLVGKGGETAPVRGLLALPEEEEMRKVALLMLVLLTVALAIVTVPAAQAAKGGGTPGCFWTCDCTGTPVCTCPPGTTGFCVYPPNIGCPQVITC